MSVRPRERSMSDGGERFMNGEMGMTECCFRLSFGLGNSKPKTVEQRINTVVISTAAGGFVGLVVGNFVGKPLEGLGIGAGVGAALGTAKVAHEYYCSNR